MKAFVCDYCSKIICPTGKPFPDETVVIENARITFDPERECRRGLTLVDLKGIYCSWNCFVKEAKGRVMNNAGYALF